MTTMTSGSTRSRRKNTAAGATSRAVVPFALCCSLAMSRKPRSGGLEARHDLGPQRVGQGCGCPEFQRAQKFLRRIEDRVLQDLLRQQLVGVGVRARVAVGEHLARVDLGR